MCEENISFFALRAEQVFLVRFNPKYENTMILLNSGHYLPNTTQHSRLLDNHCGNIKVVKTTKILLIYLHPVVFNETFKG